MPYSLSFFFPQYSEVVAQFKAHCFSIYEIVDICSQSRPQISLAGERNDNREKE